MEYDVDLKLDRKPRRMLPEIGKTPDREHEESLSTKKERRKNASFNWYTDEVNQIKHTLGAVGIMTNQ